MGMPPVIPFKIISSPLPPLLKVLCKMQDQQRSSHHGYHPDDQSSIMPPSSAIPKLPPSFRRASVPSSGEIYDSK